MKKNLADLFSILYNLELIEEENYIESKINSETQNVNCKFGNNYVICC